MAHMTYGIYVLTTRFEGAVNGMIASYYRRIAFMGKTGITTLPIVKFNRRYKPPFLCS
jgi:hypothetical protein